MEEKKPDSKLKKVVHYSGLGVQTMVLIGGGAYLGSHLDSKYQFEKPWFTLALVVTCTAIAIWFAIKTLNRINK